MHRVRSSGLLAAAVLGAVAILPLSSGAFVRLVMPLATQPAGSPFVRVLLDGSRVHVYPLPQVRAAYAGAMRRDRVEYHGGDVIHHSIPYAIYWRPNGYVMSAKYQPVIDRFFHDVGTTDQYDILVQYYDRAGKPQNASTFGGSWVDTTPYPAKLNDGDFRKEVLKAIAVNGWPKGGIGPVFFIFTASKAPDQFAYCAYHGNFVSGGRNVIYSPVPYQRDLGPHGCGTPSKVFPNDQAADLTIDTLWHEEAESISDPIDAWYSNRTGAEIGDICSTSYGPIGRDGGDTTLHGHRYVTQELWSNFDNRCVQSE